jgi:electron transfer flavoprotein beta subunit
MNVLVLIAGVADPKWPLPATADAGALQAHADKYALLSPFDEAGLELALKLRDADAGVTIHALVAGPESLARKVAEWRLDSVRRLAAGGVAAWDGPAFAAALAGAVAPLAAAATLVLTGREFGDFDDGAVAPLLARALQLPHLGLAVGVALEDGSAWVTRQRGGRIERVRLPGPALLSVTNDAQNRLRHPLLKNVMAARKLRIDAVDTGAPAATVTLAALQPVVAAPRGSACRMLQGSADEQAQALAQVLLEGAPA